MNFLTLFNTQNFDLLAVGVTIAAIGILGFVIFLENTKSHTNRAFLVMSLIAIFYAAVNYGSYQLQDEILVLWLLRLVLFASVLYSLSLLHLFFVFPQEKVVLPWWYKYFLVPIVLVVAGLTLTPFVFSHIDKLAPLGEVTNPVRGPAIAIFGIATILLVISSFALILKKTLEAAGLQRQQFKFVLLGTTISYGLLIFCNLLLPVVFNILDLIPFAPVFNLPFIVFTAYAIVKYKFLKVKVIATEILVFVLSILLLLQVLFSSSLSERLFTSGVFLAALFFSFLLIRSVHNEVEQREKIEKLAKDLEVANERLKELDRQKTEFVSIASHQLRAPLTAIKGYASLILEKSYGDYPPRLQEPVERIAESSRLMVNSIEDFLNISRIELGRLKFDVTDFNIVDLTKKVVAELTPLAKNKNLELSFENGEDAIQISADIGKVKQVITNLTDNAIKYTQSGFVKVSVSKDIGKKVVRVAIKDSGIGLSKETIEGLFEKFVRARGANKVNTTGTGLGLYVAKQLTEGQNGRVWVESEGEGKGSQFYIELPLK